MRPGIREGIRSHRVRQAATWVVLGALVAAYFFIDSRVGGLKETVETQGGKQAAVQSMLASACGAASFEELQRQGLVEECRLAQAGELDDAIPDDAAQPNDEPSEVEPDQIEDEPDATPADVKPAPLSQEQVNAAVNAYFSENGIPLGGGYSRAIKRSVTAYLTANPPEPGRPPTDGEIRSAVRAALVANPPEDGTDGADGADGSDGVGVAAASLDGCDVVFTFSDGTTDRVGPLCGDDGEPGPPPTEAQINDAFAAYCSANGECRGPTGVVAANDNCQPSPGEFVTNVDPIYDENSQTFTITCQTAPILGP